jgi:putative ABC transport system permease protein
VAAVAATVAGAVALSIANTSDQAQAKAEYTPQLPIGMALASDYSHHRSFVPAAADVLRRAGTSPQVIDGVPSSGGSSRRAEVVGRARALPISVSPVFDAEQLVADTMPPVLPEVMDARERAAADAVLAHGGVVLFAQRADALRRATFVTAHDGRGRTRHGRRLSLPAYVVNTGPAYGPALMVLSSHAAARLSLPSEPVGVVFDATRIGSTELSGLEQSIDALSPQGAEVYVERGYQVPNSERIVLWILFGLAAVLMLGGTLTATFLALSDARPDLATLSAVGASPRTRRAVAAAYAVSVGVVGAVLGAAVGFVPGIAVTYPLTRPYNSGDPGPSHYLSIPWLEIVGLVVLLPLLTAAIVGLLARSRLPLVARLD